MGDVHGVRGSLAGHAQLLLQLPHLLLCVAAVQEGAVQAVYLRVHDQAPLPPLHHHHHHTHTSIGGE